MVVGLFLAIGCKRTPEPVVVGHLAPRTGPEQAAGLKAADAAGLAVESANVDPAKHINKRPIAIVHGDTGESLEGVPQQATRLIAVNEAKALIAGRNSAEFDRLVPLAESQEIVIVSPCGGGTGPPNKFIFPVGIAARERGRCLAKYFAEERKVKDVAVVVESGSAIHNECFAGFEQEFKHADRTIRTGFNVRNSADLGPIAKRISQARPSAVLYCGSGNMFLDFRALLRESKQWFDAAALAFGGEDESVLTQSGDDRSRGVIFTAAFHSDDSAPAVQDFVTRFRLRGGREPDSEAALTYDAVNLLLANAKKVETFDARKLAPVFETMEETTCLTGQFRWTKERQPRRTVYVVEMQDGKPALRKSYTPEKK